MMKPRYLFFIFAIICLSVSSSVNSFAAPAADIPTLFHTMERHHKGPFAFNSLQGETERVLVSAGRPAAKFQFQAAFRNDIGIELAKNDFFIANLFTTNYYELMGEYVYGSFASSHPLDHEALIHQPQSMVKAASMTRHWILEKYYVRSFPNSVLAKSFQIRGISGAEFEQVYALYFLNYYLSTMTAEYQYLPLSLLTRDSPLGSSTSLDRARALIGQVYDDFLMNRFPASDPMMIRLYSIRNMIHNQLSPAALDEIDRFLTDYPFYQAEGNTDLIEVRTLLRNYFNFGTEKISDFAQRLGELQVRSIAAKIKDRGPTVSTLLELTNAVADVKTKLLVSKAYSSVNKSDAMQLILNTTLFVSKEVASLSTVDSPDVIQIVANLIYLDGFFLKDNWMFFKQQIKKTADVKKAADLLPDMIDIASDNLNQTMAPAYDMWKKVEPKMQSFVDDSLKSSAVNTASLIALKIKR
jgi:hypothetical protein